MMITKPIENKISLRSSAKQGSVQCLANNLETTDWYKSLIEDCGGIITEAVFISRWELIKGYHQLGERILQENNNFERAQIYGKTITTFVSQSLGKSKRTIERAIQFARKYPDINTLPEGKNISWYKVCNKLLSEKSDKEECAHTKVEIIKKCKYCGKKLRE